MDRKCSVCGAPMIRTKTGYKCSFCANEESISAKPAPAGSWQANVNRNNSNDKKSKNRTPIVPIVLCVVLGVLLLSVVSVLPMIINATMEWDGVPPIEDNEDYVISVEEAEEESVEVVPKTPDGFQSYSMKLAVSEIFDKPVEDITAEDLATIRYLDIETSWYEQTCSISYSTEDYHDYEPDFFEKIKEDSDDILFAYDEKFLDTVQTINVIYIDKDYDTLYEDVENFTNLNALRLDDYNYLDMSMLPNLTMVDCGGADISQMLEANLPVERIEALRVNGGDLEGIGKFTSLKKLHLVGNDLSQLEEVAKCQELDTLYCIDLSDSTSFQALGQLRGLKTLYIDGSSDGLKDLSVIASLSDLENVTITDTDILTLDFLKALENLKTLRLSENGQLVDFEGMSGLAGLTYLEFNINSLNGEQPDCDMLGNLKNLKGLALHTVYDLDFLYELEQLEELEIRLTFYDYVLEPIRKMTNLKTLTIAQCHSRYDDGFACLSELPELKSLTIDRMEFDEPVDGLFALGNLEELRITGSKFYVAPIAVTVGENLKVLDLSYTEFITMPGYGEYIYVGYEDEAIAQSVLQNYFSAAALEELYLEYYLISDLSGLSNLSNLKVLSMERCDLTEIAERDLAGCRMLEELYLSSNQISDIGFVRNLPNLKIITLADCYVADMTPLMECANLRYVDIRNNPIGENPLTGVEVRTN